MPLQRPGFLPGLFFFALIQRMSSGEQFKNIC